MVLTSGEPASLGVAHDQCSQCPHLSEVGPRDLLLTGEGDATANLGNEAHIPAFASGNLALSLAHPSICPVPPRLMLRERSAVLYLRLASPFVTEALQKMMHTALATGFTASGAQKHMPNAASCHFCMEKVAPDDTA
ncbi:hypothetical protein TREES_T100021067 [Tupaia chinensis]|uniref:Uncharacterized protein n=1 Tax=Tupaia chinensis TaxID=246437 RepID=L9JEN7_TUPCH|nr:hypothetical protein TREES_T100021067 [Tupaia chinensis]